MVFYVRRDPWLSYWSTWSYHHAELKKEGKKCALLSTTWVKVIKACVLEFIETRAQKITKTWSCLLCNYRIVNHTFYQTLSVHQTRLSRFLRLSLGNAQQLRRMMSQSNFYGIPPKKVKLDFRCIFYMLCNKSWYTYSEQYFNVSPDLCMFLGWSFLQVLSTITRYFHSLELSFYSVFMFPLS